MSTISAILVADSEGSVHLPVPEELRHGKIMVVASLTALPIADGGAAHSAKTSAWVRGAKGIVKLGAGESVEDARINFYVEKYGPTP